MSTLEYVYIPPTIDTYRGSCFIYCKNLKKVDLDENLTTLGHQLFMYCDNLTDVKIPEGVTEIPLGIFYSCGGLKEINIPKGVVKIHSTAFNATGIESIVLPEGLQEIGHHAFSGSKLKSITIPSSVTNLEYNALAIRTLEEVRILSKNIDIGIDCFKNCSSLRSVYISSESLVNSILDNTYNSTYLLYYLQNQDVLYLSEDIDNIASPYINELFDEVASNVDGYKAYKFGKYSDLKVNNFENRVYLKGEGLVGNETLTFKNPSGNVETIKLDMSVLDFFDTADVGKKLAKITYKYNTLDVPYYVLNTLEDTSLNCISRVNNLYQTYYINEDINLNNVTIDYYKVENGYMKKDTIKVTSDMVSGFSSNSEGSRILKIKYNDYEYPMTYHVKQKSSEVITSNSFEKGTYYTQDTIEESEYFKISIKKGSYLYDGYKDIIDIIYLAQQEVTGLNFAGKINIDVDDTNYPSCAGLTLNLTSADLFLVSSSTFLHELAHALEHSQSYEYLPGSTLVEGFATYVEYLTAKKLYQTNPEIYAYSDVYNNVIFNSKALADKMYHYDFEDRLLNLNRDEIVYNSQYEVGARFFSYLNYKYGDFCGFMKDATNSVTNLDDWKTMIKSYYNNDLFKDFYIQNQAFGDKYFLYFGGDEVNSLTTFSSDLSGVNKFNYYFNFSVIESSRGSKSLVYKDLYLNIDSARDQLEKKNITYSHLEMKTSNNITINLYDKNGNLIRIVTKTITNFSLSGVSFIKLVGSGTTRLMLSY